MLQTPRILVLSLLAKREDFESDISTALEEDTGRGNQGQDKDHHGSFSILPGTTADFRYATAKC